jgi:hypothetical protein
MERVVYTVDYVSYFLIDTVTRQAVPHRALLTGLLVLCLTLSASAASPHHPGWGRTALEDFLKDTLSLASLELSDPTMASLKGGLLVDDGEKLACFLRPGDTAVQISATSSIRLTLIGSEETVHTLSISHSVLNDGDSEATGIFLANLFQHLLPSWEHASNWPKQSLVESWAAVARSQQDPMVSYEEVVARATFGSAALATTGIPPDVAFYRATSLSNCQTISEASREKPRRGERIPEERNLDQTDATVRFAAPRPQPVDISETPFLIGLTSANMASARTGDLPTLDASGPLPGVEVDPTDWFNNQVIPTTGVPVASDLNDGWGYQNRFFYEVSSPLLKIAHDEHRLAMLVDTARGRVDLLWNGKKQHSWASIGGTLLSSAVPEEPLRPYFPQIYPPIATLSGPVDLSSTPIYVGAVIAYAAGEPIEGPAPYSITSSADYIEITDGIENYAEISMSNIIREMEMLPNLDQHAMPTEVYRFFLGKRLHSLVVSNLGVERDENGTIAIRFLIAHLLAAKT